MQIPVGRDAPMSASSVSIASAADQAHTKAALPQVVLLCLKNSCRKLLWNACLMQRLVSQLVCQ